MRPPYGPDGSPSLIVHHGKGKFPISQMFLPAPADFEEIARLLRDRVAR
jgi:hypothetical protein